MNLCGNKVLEKLGVIQVLPIKDVPYPENGRGMQNVALKVIRLNYHYLMGRPLMIWGGRRKNRK